MAIKKLKNLALIGVLALTSHVAMAHGVKCGDPILLTPTQPQPLDQATRGPCTL